MNINFTKELNKTLLNLAIFTKVTKNKDIEFGFYFENLWGVAEAIKKTKDQNFELSCNIIFDNKNFSYLTIGEDFYSSINLIFNELTEKSTFSLLFKTSEIEYNLNSIILLKPKDILEKICLHACYSTNIIIKDNDYCKPTILVDSKNGITKLSDKKFLHFINTNKKIDNKMRNIFAEYISVYSEKLKQIESFNSKMELVLNSY